ncbi:hypothetical protein PybrP1_009644 [[Pythium] brassicae (nom. inval.)]|nr:hypothetical protein PybrP1_009644 [[Pythium] brassicae (nom. inval.)]
MSAASLASALHSTERRPPQEIPTSPPASARADEATDTGPLLRRIAKREKKIRALAAEAEALRHKMQTAVQRVKHLELEQEQFFDDVQEMKTQYDKLSQHHQHIMWEYLPAKDADMAAIPRLDKHIAESAANIGQYPLQDVLGYGQYATVYASSAPEAPALAVKVIDKDKLTDLVALLRVNAEIASLRDPGIAGHPGVLAVRDVIHTPRFIYLVTERGGRDLFEHFGARHDGLAEPVVKALMLRVAQAVQMLHRHNYCHRDLKPENILYNPGGAPEKLVQLIDFGLCTKAVTPQDHMLRDFCGSPGFFAPEILLHECYDGRKADVWSLGCILLEHRQLVVGNSLFVALWMPMYEIEVLKDRESFAECVKLGLAHMRGHCESSKWVHSAALRQLLFGMLSEKPHERFSIHQMLDHPWLRDADSSSSSSSPVRAASPSSPVLVRQPLSPGAEPQPHASQRSPAKAKAHSTSSASTVSPFPSDGSPGDALRIGAVVPRPLSAEPDGAAAAASHAAPPSRARSPVASVKVSLPSLSPEKPVGSRSPEKTFAKRSNSLHQAE